MSRRSLQECAVAAAAAWLLGMGIASASVISDSPDLPPLGVDFVVSGGGSCFVAAGVCFTPGAMSFSSVVSSTFNSLGQDILVNVTVTGMLETLSHVPIDPLVLTGTLEEQVLGRTFAAETGSWSTEVVALSLAGPVLGHTLTLSLSASPDSTGGASVEQIGGPGDQDGAFRIDSFFDVFVDLSLDTPVPLHTTRSAHVELAEVPEPAGMLLLAGGLLGLGVARARRGV